MVSEPRLTKVREVGLHQFFEDCPGREGTNLGSLGYQLFSFICSAYGYCVPLRRINNASLRSNLVTSTFQASGRARNQKPPYLVVPFDQSGLVCVIQIEDEPRRSKKLTMGQRKRCNKHLLAKVSWWKKILPNVRRHLPLYSSEETNP